MRGLKIATFVLAVYTGVAGYFVYKALMWRP